MSRALIFIPWSERRRRRRKRIRGLPYKEALEECQTAQDLHDMAADRGYRPGWVEHVLAARRPKKDLDQ
jgi:hypothetical protein